MIISELACHYLEKDANIDKEENKEEEKKVKNSRYQEFTTGHLEDALTKVIKLLANLSTEESVAFAEFH